MFRHLRNEIVRKMANMISVFLSEGRKIFPKPSFKKGGLGKMEELQGPPRIAYSVAGPARPLPITPFGSARPGYDSMGQLNFIQGFSNWGIRAGKAQGF